jgi:hypothetical protein
MPISGVMREILDKEGGSIRGDEDFFSVASTMPLVAGMGGQLPGSLDGRASSSHTFDTECRDTLVDCVQGIFWFY